MLIKTKTISGYKAIIYFHAIYLLPGFLIFLMSVGRKITGVGRLLQRSGIIRDNLLKRLWGVDVLYTNN